METKELFAKIVSERNWHAGTGMSIRTAYMYKSRFLKNELKEAAMSKILEKLGWQKKVFWEKK